MKKAGFATHVERMGLIAAASLLMIGSGSAAFAQRSGGFHGGGGGGFHGGGGGGFHGGGGGGFHASGGFHGSGGFRAGGAFRGGGFYRGGFRGGYRGGYYGYRGGGYGWGWGPAWGLGLGVYLATLPWYYSTFWWGGVPYYYAQNDYYVWDSDADEYEQVQPPPQVAEEAQGDQPVQSGRPAQNPQQAQNGAVTEAPPQLYAYPKNGQTAQQQVMDKRECGRWASTQTGLYPATDAAANTPAQGTAAGNVGAPATAEQWQNYLRAESACLEAHGYTVE